MPQAQRQAGHHFTYGDYRTWPADERWELIDGVAYDMSPAPSRSHQEISGELFFQFRSQLIDRTCRAYLAPFDVRLAQGEESDDDTDTVVQPDLVVVCDRNKLDEKGCKGAPDLVVEILSPSTAHKDLNEKFRLYERVGVKEYWVIHPQEQTVFVFRREGALFGRPAMFTAEDRIDVTLPGELIIDLKQVFGATG